MEVALKHQLAGQFSLYAYGMTTEATAADLPIYQVLIVEDDPQTRAYFASCVRSHAQLRLFAEAASVAQGRALMEQAKASGSAVDVLLTDLGLPDGSGLELIAYAAQHRPGCESLVISMFGDEDNVLASIEAGATGYLHKDSAPADIAQSIMQLKSGESPMSPMIARRLLGKYRSLSAGAASKAAAGSVYPSFSDRKGQIVSMEYAQSAINSVVSEAQLSPKPSESVLLPEGIRMLSKRETEVLEHISRGFSYAEVANMSHVSVHTVQTHIKNIYGKLSVHNRSEAVFEAQRLGLLSR
jgi:DNA-binding NarL/FixJ family response regulator